MRLALFAGLVLLISQPAQAQDVTPEEAPIELGPPPPPPPGAEQAIESDGPAPPEPAEPPGLLPSPATGVPPPSPDPPASLASIGEPDFPPDDRAISIPKQDAAGSWYGWQIFIGDASAGVWALLPPPSGFVYGGGTYLIAAPAIHLGHKRGLAALGSFALRLSVPLATSALVDRNVHCVDWCFKPGMVVSAIAVSVVDGVWIAREGGPEPPKSPSGDFAASRGISIAPAVAVSREATSVSVGGRF